ncbi:ABC transporter permease [Acidisoma silvae]|uniref:ABC transporter permease n=1 Tax=Acidisoma silvae TaxID=2802396 RepID=A0A963YVJ2_9PROT|nr:ABC transporter permease [Acidisoma silvae]MCB8877629.1 ABC transporter permease [Acidisoma silvae]
MIDFLAASIRIATPLVFAALGGILSERAGVFAVGLEGMMLMGAFGAVIGAWASASDLLGLAMALAGGAAMGLAVAIVTVRYRADNMVTGLTVNILAAGLTTYLLHVLAGSSAIQVDPLGPWPIPGLSAIPVLGPLLFAHPPLTYLALLGCAGLSFLLYRTQTGLKLRAAGENPEAVFVAGSSPMRLRFTAIICGGAIAGLGGAVLSLQQVGTFTDGMTGGRGYLALASLIVGRWNPWGAAAACLVFGAAEAFELRLQTYGVPVSSYVVQMVPYLIALAVLAGLGRSTKLPAAIGKPL